MSNWFKNPIAITFVAIALSLLLISVVTGMALTETLQLLIAPYSYDFSNGFGSTLARYVAMGLLGVQVLFIFLFFSVPKIPNTLLRRVLWGFGVALVVAYFMVMLVSYVSTGIH